jgi:predicted short-subunit dehydrogenase-like oxidoreductase (DUF2520 family)
MADIVVPDDRHLAVIGAGRVGSALAYLARQKGYEITGLCCHYFENAKKAAAFLNQTDAARKAPGHWLRDAGLILIATPDDVIEPVCAQIAAEALIQPKCIVAHCSGAHPSSILQPAADQGCPIGSVHPLQSCATRELAIRELPGSYFCVEGFDEAKRVLKDFVNAMNGKILEIATEDKPLYHAGATVASNFLVGLIHFALVLYDHIGIDPDKGLEALAPLLDGTIRNVKSVGIPEALTGPIMRGDLGTVEAHLEALQRAIPDYLALYCVLGLETTKVAISKGTIGEAKGQQLQRLFKRFQERP